MPDPNSASAEGVVVAVAATPLLDVRGLVCVRHDRTLFRDLGFTLAAGEITQIEGANGSGKTSLLRLLCGLMLPAAGEVRWRGQDIQADRAGFFTELCYIGHHPGIKEELTPRENLRMALALGRARDGIGIDAALEQVGLYGYEDLPTRTLSAGQRRRVALARLLIVEATLWILDEPFTALDAQGRALIEGMLEAHSRRGGAALLTTHQPLSLAHCAMSRVRLTA